METGQILWKDEFSQKQSSLKTKQKKLQVACDLRLRPIVYILGQKRNEAYSRDNAGVAS